jgi:hypothetical protein
MIGFQVESLLLQNRTLLLNAMGLPSFDVVADNPYIQRPTVRHKGCQIDYLIHTRGKTLFVAEFKFNRKALGLEVIEEMQDKISRFSVPRGCGIAPVLFTLGGATESVHEKRYFYRIIELANFLV